jgi:acetyl-CoA carboxylase biotin carboxyl carrier protein
MAKEVEAQITGNIWKIEKAAGDTLAEGEVILIMESMKMEIPVESPCDGTLREVRVAEGDAVEEGAILALID